jgi:hypothetical protein
MITLLKIRIQILNGSNTIIEKRVLKSEKQFDDRRTLEEYRKKKELMLQYREIVKFKRLNPKSSAMYIKENCPKISVLFNTEEK